MASRKGSEIERALLSKGFRYSDTHHRYLILHVGEKRTAIRTYVSHNLEYGDSLLGQVRKQLHLSSRDDVLRLVDCPMSGDEYVAHLRDQGLL
jgi:hypothetical protein